MTRAIRALIDTIWNSADWELQVRLIAPTLNTEDARALRRGIQAKQEQALRTLPRRLLNADGSMPGQ